MLSRNVISTAQVNNLAANRPARRRTNPYTRVILAVLVLVAASYIVSRGGR
jgi:hypothetical protein